jgi:hypothetical protein
VNAAAETPDSFEEFARATGLADLLDLDPAALDAPDDAISATDEDGDSLTLVYREATAEDGEAVGTVAIKTDGPTGIALVGITGMEALVEWLQARIVRAKALEAE